MLNIIIPEKISINLNENWIEIKSPYGFIKKKKSQN